MEFSSTRPTSRVNLLPSGCDIYSTLELEFHKLHDG
jgi:hypothetical protein